MCPACPYPSALGLHARQLQVRRSVRGGRTLACGALHIAPGNGCRLIRRLSTGNVQRQRCDNEPEASPVGPTASHPAEAELATGGRGRAQRRNTAHCRMRREASGTDGAVDNGHGCPPVPLPRDEPVRVCETGRQLRGSYQSRSR